MRVSTRFLAAPSSVGTPGGGLRTVPLALLPPIPLYRRILRTHRKHLPQQMRVLGDEYVKSEFRAHRNIDNPVHIVSLSDRGIKIGYFVLIRLCGQIGFLTEWQMYAQKVEGDDWLGEKMDPAKFDKMSGMS